MHDDVTFYECKCKKFTNMINFLEYSRLLGMLITKGEQYDIIYIGEGAFVLTDTLSYKNATPPPSAISSEKMTN